MKHILYTLSLILLTSAAYAQDDGTLKTDSTSNSKVTTDSNTTIKSPPASAISPSINTSNSDLCTVGVSGAVQTQILGLSAGKTVRDLNCERLKNAKTLYDMGMKVAAVSVMCHDSRVFDAMLDAGTPCPYDGMIGSEAKLGWENNPALVPKGSRINEPVMNESRILKGMDQDEKSTLFGGFAVGGLLLLLLL
jgi:hypothetical protein